VQQRENKLTMYWREDNQWTRHLVSSCDVEARSCVMADNYILYFIDILYYITV